MSKEETLTAEKFQAEHYKDASCCSLRLWTNEMVEQYAQAKVEELQKENEILADMCSDSNGVLYAELCHEKEQQITQLQKEIEEKDEMIRQALIHSDELNPSFKQVIEALTNKKEG